MNKTVPPAFSQLLLSSADSLSGYLDVGGSQTSFGPVGQAAGAAPPAFHQTRRIAAFEHTYGGDAVGANRATLQIDATNLVNTANSAGLGVDAVSTQATSDLGSANIVLTANPLNTLSMLGLSVSATLIHSRVRCVLCVRTKSGISRWRCQLRLAYDRWCADRKSADFRRRPHGQHDSLSKCVRDNHFGQADIFRVPSTVGPGADPAQPNYDRCGRYLSQPCASIRQDHIRQHHAWRNLGKPVPAASRVKPDGICASSMRATANRKPAFGWGVPSRLCPNQVKGAAFASRNGVLLSARSRSSRDGAQRSPYC